MANVKKNLVYNMTYQVLILILPLITTPYISRVLGANGLGIFSFYHAIALYFVYFSMLGVLNYGNREISKKTGDKKDVKNTFSSIYSLQLITSLIFTLLYICFALLFARAGEKYIALIFVIHTASAFFDISWLFFGSQEFKIPSICQMVARILSFIAIFIFVKTPDDLWKYSLIMTLSYILPFLPLWHFRKKYISKFNFNFSGVRQHIKPSLILFVPIIATSVFRIMDKIMLGLFCDMKTVGFYENAEKLITISLGVVASFGAVIMPKITNLLATRKKAKALKMIYRSMEVAMCFGVGVCFGIIATANELVPIFFGEEFVVSVPIAILLAFSAPLITWSAIIRLLYLIPFERDKVYVKSVIIGACINLVANFIFIQYFQAFGAVIGTILAEGFIVFFQSFYARKTVHIKNHVIQSIIFCVFGIIMTLAVRFIADTTIKMGVGLLVIEILVGGMVYAGLSSVYFLVFSKSKNDVIYNIKGFVKKIGSRHA